MSQFLASIAAAIALNGSALALGVVRRILGSSIHYVPKASNDGHDG